MDFLLQIPKSKHIEAYFQASPKVMESQTYYRCMV